MSYPLDLSDYSLRENHLYFLMNWNEFQLNSFIWNTPWFLHVALHQEHIVFGYPTLSNVDTDLWVRVMKA